MEKTTDVLIIGAGIAGLTVAKQLAGKMKVTIIAKKKNQASSTTLAQGGIAASLANDDSPLLHMQDTLKTGCGLSKKSRVKVLVNEGPKRVEELMSYDIFDKKDDGSVEFSREAAHSRNRIVHSGDSTGNAVEKLLTNLVTQKGCRIIYDKVLIDLMIEKNRAYGAFLFDDLKKEIFPIYAKNIVLATGGYAQIYENNTNTETLTGDGLAIAFRHGAILQDLEFVQFHPTTLYKENYTQDSSSFLISEAVRGEGGIILNTNRKRFLFDYYPQGELAARDKVSRAIFLEMQKNHTNHVLLDMSRINKNLRERFPRIYHRCKLEKHNIEKDLIPIVPAAHYCMGGIRTDSNGKTSIQNLFAVGEVACTGIHGANRLASNSLLEGMVFGQRAAEKILKSKSSQLLKETTFDCTLNLQTDKSIRQKIKKIMWQNVGIIRSKDSLLSALKLLKEIQVSQEDFYNNNLLLIARLVTQAALIRTESRGAHYRCDYPKSRFRWKKHIYLLRNKNL